MMAAGIPVYGYRCSQGGKHHFFDELAVSRRYEKTNWDQRSHEKIWLVNDQEAIVGGINIGNDYFRLNKKGFEYWRDQDLLVRGKEVIQDLINVFEGGSRQEAPGVEV